MNKNQRKLKRQNQQMMILYKKEMKKMCDVDIIQYNTKQINNINEEDQIFIQISYEINIQDLYTIKIRDIEEDYKLVLKDKENKLYDILTNNLKDNRLIEAGITMTGRAVINQYISKKGFDKLVEFIKLNL